MMFIYPWRLFLSQQTVLTLVKCRIMWHFNWVFTVRQRSVYEGLSTQKETLLSESKLSQILSDLTHIGLALGIENTRWVSFDIKFTRQGFENACWHCEAWWSIQHEFSKPSLVNLISKTRISVYPLFHSSKIFYFILSSEINAYQKQIKVISITSEMIW